MISAKVIAHSSNEDGKEIVTILATFPRYILAELNTHRAFSRNSASSRAIPFSTMIKNVQENPFIPVAWQKDHKGMQGINYFEPEEVVGYELVEKYLAGRDSAVYHALELHNAGDELLVTKQLCNRLLEPYMWHTAIITATDWQNFFDLRCPMYESAGSYFKSWSEYVEYRMRHEKANRDVIEELEDASILERLKINKGAADIHFTLLAEAIYDAINNSRSKYIANNEWHLPFGDDIDEEKLKKVIFEMGERPDAAAMITSDFTTRLNSAKLQIAVARCARVSYTEFGASPESKHDYKADIERYYKLANMGHWSPFEHVATPCVGRDRNFDGWKQIRAILDGGEYSHKYLIIQEDGTSYATPILHDYDLKNCDDGIIEIINVANLTTYYEGSWSKIELRSS